MTYKITKTTALNVRLIELSLSSAQTVSSGNTVAFDTLTASDAGHGVSVSNGVISLDTDRRYWVQASMHIDRASTSSSWEFAFFDDTQNVEIDAPDGGYRAKWDWHDVSSFYGKPTATFTATYVSPDAPFASISLRTLSVAAGSTVRTDTRIIIIEATP